MSVPGRLRASILPRWPPAGSWRGSPTTRRLSEPGRWTARDHLAHLAAWREHAAAVLDAARTGAPAPVVADEDERNAEIHAMSRTLASDAMRQ